LSKYLFHESDFFMPCHGAWTSPLSAHLSIKWECTASQIKTAICNCSQLISSSDNNKSAAIWADHRWNTMWLESTMRLHYFHLQHWHLPYRNGPAKNSVGAA